MHTDFHVPVIEDSISEPVPLPAAGSGVAVNGTSVAVGWGVPVGSGSAVGSAADGSEASAAAVSAGVSSSEGAPAVPPQAIVIASRRVSAMNGIGCCFKGRIYSFSYLASKLPAEAAPSALDKSSEQDFINPICESCEKLGVVFMLSKVTGTTHITYPGLRL